MAHLLPNTIRDAALCATINILGQGLTNHRTAVPGPHFQFLILIIKQIIYKVNFSMHSPDLLYPVHIQTPCDSLHIVTQEDV